MPKMQPLRGGENVVKGGMELQMLMVFVGYFLV